MGKTLEHRVKSVKQDMEETADSLEFLAQKILEPKDGTAWKWDFAFAVLNERAAHIRGRADELPFEFGVKEPEG